MKTLKITMEARFDPKDDAQAAHLQEQIALINESSDELLLGFRAGMTDVGFVGGTVKVEAIDVVTEPTAEVAAASP